MSEEHEASREEKRVLSAIETVLFAFNLLEQKAWISLGLIKDTDGEFHKSRDDARLLIDLLDKMAEGLKGKVEEKIFEELRNQVANLQLNFVNQFK